MWPMSIWKQPKWCHVAVVADCLAMVVVEFYCINVRVDNAIKALYCHILQITLLYCTVK